MLDENVSMIFSLQLENLYFQSELDGEPLSAFFK